MTWEEKWELYYNLAVNYYNYYKHLNIPYEFKTKNGKDYDENGYPLGRWLYNQRKAFAEGKLKLERLELLKKIEVNLKIENNSTWSKYVELIQNHIKKYNKITFSEEFKTFDGINYNQDGYPLGKWHENYCERARYENFPKEKRNFLISLGIKINIVVRKYTWDEVYAMLKNYYLKNKNVNVPRKFKTIDGITENENGILLSDWLYYQIKEYKNGNLKTERKKLLEDVGVNFSKYKSYEEKWMDTYDLLKNYYEHYHDLNIPVDFLTEDGITYSRTGTNIYSWKRTQNAAYINGKLSKEREKLLLDIKFDFHDKTNDELWEESFELLKVYKETYGHLDLEKDFKTTNGIDYDKNGKNLTLWLQNQKALFKQGKLLSERYSKLSSLGLDFNSKKNDEKWEESFELLKVYKETYGHFNLEKDFKTTNGIDYDENGKNLTSWLRNQKVLFRQGKLLPERYIKLSTIDLNWNYRINEEKIMDICVDYNIDMKSNANVITHINHYELNAKIHYLEINNLPLFQDGKLHEIFSMCSANMLHKYNIDYENLIVNYFNKEYYLERKAS